MKKLNKPNIFKRFSALIIDVMLWFLLSIFSLSLFIDPMVNSLMDYNNKNNTYTQEMYELNAIVYVEYKSTSSSYEYLIRGDVSTLDFDELIFDEDGKYTLVSLSTSNLVIDIDTFDKYLTYFYSKIDDLDNYNANKVNSDLFDEDGNALESSKVEDLKNYYIAMFESGLQSEKLKSYKDGVVYSLAEQLNTINYVKAYGSYIFSFLVFYLAIPLINKNRQTVGKIVMKLIVVNLENDEVASRLKMVIRFAALLLLEFLVSMILSAFLYLPLFISIVMMVITINQTAVHDLVAKTRVVEKNPYCNINSSEVIDADFVEHNNNEQEENLSS